MELEEVEQIAIDKYQRNIEFLSKHSPGLHYKITLFEEALNNNHIQAKFELEYKENSYFNIFDMENNNWFYAKDSNDYSKDIVNSVNLNSKENSFKTFYDAVYEEGVLEKVKDVSILSDSVFGNAPVFDYINKNSPTDHKLKQIYCYMIFGVGLGLHIPLLHNKIKSKLYLIVEPSLELFRLSLFVTDYQTLANSTQFIFFVAQDKNTFTKQFRIFHDQAYLYNHYIKFFLFSKTSEIYFECIQSILSSQSHTMFSYDRELRSLIVTSIYAQEKYKFLDVTIKNKFEFCNDKPMLLLAGGPSLNKNIEFVKKNQDKFIIVSLFSLCNFLEKNGITPDIITNYDEQLKIFMDVYNNIQNKSYFKDKIMLFGSHVNSKLVDVLPKDNIYFFNAMYSAKKDIGYIIAPSIGEMSYSLMLRFTPKEIYLLGLDLSLDPDTGSSHFDGYNENSKFTPDKDATVEKFSFRKNILKVKGNFRNEVETPTVFDVSIKQFNLITEVFNAGLPSKVYNLSDGAYLENTTPLKADDINTDKYESIDKEILIDKIKESLNTISSDSFSIEDDKYNEDKINGALLLKNKLDSFYIGRKYPNDISFLKLLEELDAELDNKEYSCEDLNTILKNYCRYNFPAIFYFLNLRNVNNPKSHMKKLYKSLNKQMNKIVDLYIDTTKKNIKGKDL